MAKLEPLIDKIQKWEGGFVNHPYDRGGPTNKGITLRTWQSMGYDKDGDFDIDESDLKMLTKADFVWLLRNYYWNRWRANEILNQSVAELLVDWLWCSGKPAITTPQRILRVNPDGLVGPITLTAVNRTDPKTLHAAVKHARIRFIRRIITNDPSQACFEKGWLRRIESFTYEKTQAL